MERYNFIFASSDATENFHILVKMTDLVACVILFFASIGSSNYPHAMVLRCLNCFTKGTLCAGSLIEQVCAQEEQSFMQSKLVVFKDILSIAT